MQAAKISGGISGGSVVKYVPPNAGHASSIPDPGRSLGVGNGNPLQYSCLGNPMTRGAWWATGHGFPKSQNNLAAKREHGNFRRKIQQIQPTAET